MQDCVTSRPLSKTKGLRLGMRSAACGDCFLKGASLMRNETKTRKPRDYKDEFVRNRTRVETLLVDLGLTSTFVSVAEVSSGAKRQRNIEHARNAFCTIRDVLSRACTPSDAECKEIDRQLRQLKHRLLQLSTSAPVLPFRLSPDIGAVRKEQLFNNQR